MTSLTGVIISRQNQAYIYGLATVLLWSTVGVAFKLALRQLDIFQLVFYATLFATLILLGVAWFRGSFHTLRDQFASHWKITLISGWINPVLYYLILFAAYDRLPAQVVQPINYTWAIVLTFLSIFFLGQRITRADFVAAFVCYAGVVVIAMQGQFPSAQSFQTAGLSVADESAVVGLLLAIVSTFIWATYWIINVRDQREPSVAVCLNFIVALPVSFLACLIFSSPSVSSLEELIGAVYIGFAEMAIAFLLWSKALRMAENTSKVSNLVFISPFISLVLIHLILGESIHSTAYIVLSLIVGGLLYQQYSSASQQN